eukprot:545574_1
MTDKTAYDIVVYATIIHNSTIFSYYIYKLFRTRKERAVLTIEWLSLFVLFTMTSYPISIIVSFNWSVNISLMIYSSTKLSTYNFALERLFIYSVNDAGFSMLTTYQKCGFRFLLCALTTPICLLCLVSEIYSDYISISAILLPLISIVDLIINLLISVLLTRRLSTMSSKRQQLLKRFVTLSLISIIWTQFCLISAMSFGFRFKYFWMSIETICTIHFVLLAFIYDDKLCICHCNLWNKCYELNKLWFCLRCHCFCEIKNIVQIKKNIIGNNNVSIELNKVKTMITINNECEIIEHENTDETDTQITPLVKLRLRAITPSKIETSDTIKHVKHLYGISTISGNDDEQKIKPFEITVEQQDVMQGHNIISPLITPSSTSIGTSGGKMVTDSKSSVYKAPAMESVTE